MKDLSYKKALALTSTERKMLRMLNWHKLAIKAHTRANEAMDRLDAYDRDLNNPRAIWTLTESREGLLQKAVDHTKAHLYCLNKANQIKETL